MARTVSLAVHSGCFPSLCPVFFCAKLQNIMRLEFDLTYKYPLSLSKSAASYLTHTSHFHPKNFSFSTHSFASSLSFFYLSERLKRSHLYGPTQVTALSLSALFLFYNSQPRAHMYAHTHTDVDTPTTNKAARQAGRNGISSVKALCSFLQRS